MPIHLDVEGQEEPLSVPFQWFAVGYEELPRGLPFQFHFTRRARTKRSVEFRVLQIPILPGPIRHVGPKLPNPLSGGSCFPRYLYDRDTRRGPDDRSRHRNRDRHADDNESDSCRFSITRGPSFCLEILSQFRREGARSPAEHPVARRDSLPISPSLPVAAPLMVSSTGY